MRQLIAVTAVTRMPAIEVINNVLVACSGSEMITFLVAKQTVASEAKKTAAIMGIPSPLPLPAAIGIPIA
ncbi:hypothetical protein [Corynebacterium pelargi]|uniref:Uncharacterized protein n=1 Tax=Corynebacterium pelargi TaxID=1471400 RepID=A0A410WAK8_9CORY|nr:hypothetical protein [Corynebacterium pelargi]QAU52985.1 hypothetical protein CPELA_08650 [Corynebacterium pelargi]GGG82561.1 hypothetical protein GCM10007338_21880 [Corynebacterium pelargi]